MNGLIMLLLGVLLAIKPTSTGGTSTAIIYQIPINSTYVVLASTNNSVILYLLTTRNDIEYAVMVVPRTSIKEASSLLAMGVVNAEGYFPGVLDFANGTSYVGFYEGRINNTLFMGYFIPVIETGGSGVPSYPLTGGPGGSEITVTVESKVPLVLRYYSFDSYNFSSNDLMNTQTPIPVLTGYPPITISMAVGTECREYMVYESFSSPVEAIPEPFIVNTGRSVSLVVANVTLVSTTPTTTVSLLEPGDLLLSSQPVINAVFELTVCHVSQGMNYTGIENLYARDYLAVNVNISWPLITRYLGFLNGTDLQLVNELLSDLNSGRFSLSTSTYPITYTLINGTGSPLDYALLSMYILRLAGVPARIAVGLVGEPMGNGTYVFKSSDSTLWVEAFTKVGWVPFVPINAINSHGVPIPVILTGVLASLILMIPWLIGYYVYYYLGRRR